MGFSGHTVVGIFMISLSVAGLVKTLWNYVLSKRHCKEFRSNGKLTLSLCPNIPVIALVQLTVFTTAFVLSLTSSDFRFTDPDDGRFTPSAVLNSQHMSMFCPFIFHSVVEVISSRGGAVPDGLVDVTAAISLSWGAFSIRSEQNLSDFGYLIHKLPANLLYITACMSLVECFRNHSSVIASTLKSYFLLCFGTWYIQSNFIPYRHTYLDEIPNPKWNQTDEHLITNEIMAVFGCHLILGQILIGILFSTKYLTLKRQEPYFNLSRREEKLENILYERK